MPRVTAIVPATNRPETLTRCAGAIRAAADPPDELIIVDQPEDAGPANARNAGARDAIGDVLVFVDADVEVHRDAFTRIRSALERDPGLTGLFGSYDDAPEATGLVSTFRNLLHHHVHQSSPGPVATFWAGLGAVRRSAYLSVGGFDEKRYPLPSIEDVDLGMRLSARGARIELDPGVQGAHLKAWSLREMMRTDFLRRGVPWVALLLRSRSRSAELNLGWRHRLSAAASFIGIGGLVRRRPGLACGSLLALVALNYSFYSLLLRRCGPIGAAAGVGLHVVHHLTAVGAVPVGILVHVFNRGREREAGGAS